MKTTDSTSGMDDNAFDELRPELEEGSENLENNGRCADEISTVDEISKKEDPEDFNEGLNDNTEV
jgi:hypothetical protein